MLSVAARLSKEQNTKGNGGFGWFRLKKGESAILRFLTPMVDCVVVNHASAGCNCNIEIPKMEWDKGIAEGKPIVCPVCGKPFSDADIVDVKEGTAGGDFHFVKGANRSVWCLNDPENQQPYSCPLCEQEVEKEYNGRKYMAKNNPSPRLYGYAVVREAEYETTVNSMGIPDKQVKSIKDKMIEKDGEMVPEVVMVNQAYGNFWSILNDQDPTYFDSITYYDWEIQRIDERTYRFNRLNFQTGETDNTPYKPYMTRTLADLVASMGTPQAYNSCGIQVEGYANENVGYKPNATVASATQALQQAAQPVQQVQPVQQPVPMQGIPAQPVTQVAQPVTQVVAQPAQTIAAQPVQTAPVQAVPVQTAPVQDVPAQPVQQVQQIPTAVPTPSQAPSTIPWQDVQSGVYDNDIPFD